MYLRKLYLYIFFESIKLYLRKLYLFLFLFLFYENPLF